MTNVKLSFFHDECGNEAQIHNAYFRTDCKVLLEGVCLACAESFVKMYDAAEMLIEFTEREPA